MSQVFSYVIFFNPNYESSLQEPEIISEGTLVAKNLEKARLLAGRMIPESYLNEIDDIEVLVRPF
jgi:hypothetical protein